MDNQYVNRDHFDDKTQMLPLFSPEPQLTKPPSNDSIEEHKEAAELNFWSKIAFVVTVTRIILEETSQFRFSRLIQHSTYDSINERMKAEREIASSKKVTVFTLIGLVLGGFSCSLWLGFYLLRPFYQIIIVVIGIIYKNDCPIEPWIPVLLIVSGICGVIVSGSGDNKLFEISNCILALWFVAGNVWVYRAMGNWSDDPEATNYCHRLVFYVAFWNITSVYIIFFCFLAILIGIVLIFR
ncbi:unnamed protein product [Mytilus coruscus]|uniref:Transmembrane protein n=1 Tax=Mytilus coruscus TaxID=42192 RepID=A0A6J8CWZ4_MYTCO|nr:unnamed protein product [Mytilus coruscus]CAC5400067.1 unnamed protein product [Mytilus coruscus]